MCHEKHTCMDSETYYRTLMEIFPNAILVFDLNGVILDANVKAAELFRIPDDISLKGQNLYNLVVSENNEQVIANISAVILHEELHDFELRLQRHDGTVFWGSLTAKLIPSPIEFPVTILALIRDITEKKITDEKLRTLAVTDDLTGLFNRRGYTIAAEQEIKHEYRRKEVLILLFFDIDNFKMINTTYGHAEGDKAIIKVSQVLRNTFRESDIVARWGGDEFVVVALDVPICA